MKIFRHFIIVVFLVLGYTVSAQLITDSDARLMTIKGEKSGFLFFQKSQKQNATGSPFSYNKNKVSHRYSPGHPFDFNDHRVKPRYHSKSIPFDFQKNRVTHHTGSLPIPFPYKDYKVPHRPGSLPIPFPYKDHRVAHSQGSMPIPFPYRKHRVPHREGSMPIPFPYNKHRVASREGSMPIPFAYNKYRVKPRASASSHPFKPYSYKIDYRYSEKVKFTTNRWYLSLALFDKKTEANSFTGPYKYKKTEVSVSKRDQGYTHYKTGLPIGNFTLGNNLGGSSVNGKVATPKFDRKEKEIWNN